MPYYGSSIDTSPLLSGDNYANLLQGLTQPASFSAAQLPGAAIGSGAKNSLADQYAQAAAQYGQQNALNFGRNYSAANADWQTRAQAAQSSAGLQGLEYAANQQQQQLARSTQQQTNGASLASLLQKYLSPYSGGSSILGGFLGA